MKNNSFETTLLYNQSMIAPEGEIINSSVYTASYYYPNATAPTVIRLKIVCIFDMDSRGNFTPHSGWAEKWTSEGWVVLDEYLGQSRSEITSPESLRSNVIKLAQSFLLGIPISEIEDDQDSQIIETPPNSSNEPKLRVLKFDLESSDEK